MITRVELPLECLHTIRGAAEAAYPAECCGLLIGRPESEEGLLRVTRVAPSVNLLAAEVGRFEVDPALRFRLMRELREGPERIVGHYHSHPDGPAAPSARDAEMAYEADLLWLIISVPSGRAGDAAAFFPSPAPHCAKGGPKRVFRRVLETVR